MQQFDFHLTRENVAIRSTRHQAGVEKKPRAGYLQRKRPRRCEHTHMLSIKCYGHSKQIKIHPSLKMRLPLSLNHQLKTTLQYEEKLVAKALRCEYVYEQHDLNEIFTDALENSIGQRMIVN